MSSFKVGCALVVLAGCGDVKGKSIDAAMHDGPKNDAAVDADTRACDPAKPFGQPKNIMELNTTAADAYIYLSPDELTAYISTNGGPSPQGNYDLYVTSRSSITGTFSTPITPLSNVDTAASQEAVAVTTDGLTLYYYDSTTNNGDIYTATRSTPTATFGTGSAVAVINNTTAHDHCPYPSPDNLTLYFCSTRNNSSNIYDLFVTTRANTSSPFSNPTAIAELNSTQFGEENEAVTGNGLVMYYASDKTGTTGALDIWRADRPTTTDLFGNVTNVAEINSAVDEWPTYISDDDCRLYFSGDRGGGKGSHDLWLAVRPK